MNSGLRFASAPTPKPGTNWTTLSAADRLALVSSTLQASMPELLTVLRITDTKPDGQVIVHLEQALPAAVRGTMLLDLESQLKQEIDPALVVWHEALNDRSPLRKLRGIEVKA